MDVGEIGVGAAHLADPAVHHGHKGLLVAGNVLCQGNGRVIGALHDQAVDQVIHRQLLGFLQVYVLGAAGQAGNIPAAHRHHILRVAVFNGQQSGDHFGQAAGGQSGIRVVGIHQRAGAALEGDGCLGAVQPPVGAPQGDIAVDGAAAVEDAHAAEGQLRVGRGAVGDDVLGFFRHRLRKSAGGKVEKSQQKGSQAEKNGSFFHNSPSYLTLPDLPG